MADKGSENGDNNNSELPIRVTVNAAPVNVKSKWVALLLCFFLGAIGAHKFYEGKLGMGILYLFTVGLFFIGAVVDFFILLFKPAHYTP